MTDINCSQCKEPWDVYGLKYESIGYIPAEETHQLDPLGTAEDALIYIGAALGSGRAHDLRVAHTTVQNSGDLTDTGEPTTLAELTRWYWDLSDLDSGEAKAVCDIVQNAIYAAVANGKGCPSCGFAHRETGAHRDVTMRQLVDGVDDTDPIIHLLHDQG